MGIPTTGTIVDSQVSALREIQDLYKDYIDFVYPVTTIRRIFHDFARNEIVKEFLSTDCDVLWFLDSDVTPSKHFLELLVNEGDKWEAAGATYPVFMTLPEQSDLQVVFTVYKKKDGEDKFTIGNAPKKGKEFVDGLATGCLLLKRSIFEKLSEPYFEFKFDEKTRYMTEGEDLGFCRKLSQLGIKFYTDFEYVCKHQKTVDLLDVNNYAIAMSNAAVLEYDRIVKETAIKTAQDAYSAGYIAALEKVRTEYEKEHSRSNLVTPEKTLWLPK